MANLTTKELNRTQLKGIIIGMVLGDGCLKRGIKNQNSHFESSSICLQWLEEKKKILEQLTEVKIREDAKIKGYNKKPLYALRTLAHPIYKKIKMRMYHNGRRTIDEFCLKTISSLGILIWYLDDGCLAKDKRINSEEIRIYSNAYNYAEHLLMKKIINDKFGLRFNINQSWNKNQMKRYLHLRLKRADTQRFYDLIIKPNINLIPEELKYKIPIKVIA